MTFWLGALDMSKFQYLFTRFVIADADLRGFMVILDSAIYLFNIFSPLTAKKIVLALTSNQQGK